MLAWDIPLCIRCFTVLIYTHFLNCLLADSLLNSEWPHQHHPLNQSRPVSNTATPMYTSVGTSCCPSLPLAFSPGAREPVNEDTLPPAKKPRIDVSHPPAQSPPYYNPGGQCSAFHTYAEYLKSVYTRDKLPIYDRWPQVKSKKYINLALLEKENITKKRQISLQEPRFMEILMISESQSELQILVKLPSFQMDHNQSAFLWRGHQVLESPP